MKRIDVLLVDLNHATSRTHAQKLISSGRVKVQFGTQWKVITKPSFKLDGSEPLEIESHEEDKYASRGGLKLEGALKDNGIDVTNMIGLDVGCSTGGFTDCLLQAGAKHVVGVEVGHDQLVQKLRNDSRVTLYEGINARELDPALVLPHTDDNEGFDIVVMDVSFISQTKILPALAPVMKTGGHLVSLVKPQFEVGKEGIGKGGIVKDPALYKKVEKDIREMCSNLGMTVKNYTESPIKGGDGNREFLIWAVKEGS
ncbi:TlyA family RNA methyltransferase [Litoribacillus peritrichatus]|uniref:TlyA family rRNA (Cytidine-2'-O)-methyltransferase n=1 Tax=Litoribacillus peritrichatus TaxID=718191 RepID=A0ABP7N0M8_9GAMM